MPVLTPGEKGLKWYQPPGETGGPQTDKQTNTNSILTCSCLVILGIFFSSSGILATASLNCLIFSEWILLHGLGWP